MSEKLLSEYQGVLKELEMIKNRVNVIKDVTEDRIKCARTGKEKENIFTEFKTQLSKIRNDKNIKHKYKTLKKRKEMIETEMMDKMSERSSECKNRKPSKKPQKKCATKKSTNISKKKPIKKQKCYSSSESSYYESSSSSISQCAPKVKRHSDVNVDIGNLINKYKKTTNAKCYDSSEKENTSESCSSSSQSERHNRRHKTTKYINPKVFKEEDCNNKKSTNIKKKKETGQTGDDMKQMKKLCNLIESLKCEIDK